FFFFSSRRRHTRCLSDWSSDVCSSDLGGRASNQDKLPNMNIAPALKRKGQLQAIYQSEVKTVVRWCLVMGLSAFGANLNAQQSRSEEHTSELQSLRHLVCRLLLEKKKA